MLDNLILFHRRLIALSFVLLCILAIFIVQTARLTIVQGEQRYKKAQGRLHSVSYLPTWRGNIVDRKGRMIAEDVPSYNIAVDWDLITGDRATEFAGKDARSSVSPERWRTMSPEEKEVLIESFLPERQEELQHFWAVIAMEGGVTHEELQRRLSVIREEVQQTVHVVWARQEESHRKRYGDDVPFEAQPIREQREPHVVLPRVSDAVAMRFEVIGEVFDGVIAVQHARQRAYPYRKQQIIIDRSTLPKQMRQFDAVEIVLDGVAELLVGDVRDDVWAQDIEQRPFRNNGETDLGGYRSGDEVGNRGLEASLESLLRGTRGQVVLHKDGEELSRTQPVGGSQVNVTLDIELQARIEAVLSPELGLMRVQPWHRNTALQDGTPLRGAVVVLDIATSEVLAMVSTPALRDEEDVDGYPWLNRAAEGLYPPGSIIKPLVLVSAMTEGKFEPDDSIECVGHYFEHVKDAARCWIYRSKYNNATHGSLQAVEAIARSCNIFFYELGSRLGFDGLMSWLRRFGMSKPLSTQLTNSQATGSYGHMPSSEDIDTLRKRGAIAFETVSVAIGQGALTWTPLHAAAAYATLARGGVWKSPTLVQGNTQHEENLNLHKDSVRLALMGLRDSLGKRYGTGALLRYGPSDEEPTFNIEGLRLWGKTGTAEAPPYRLNKDSPPITGLDHSWFIVMASNMKNKLPTVVIAVLVEHGGSGGRVAGPIANQVLYALQAEGYLEQER